MLKSTKPLITVIKMSAILQQRQGTYKHSLSVKEYHLLWKAGLLNDRIELIEGVIYDMAPIGGKHISLTNLLTMTLARCVDPLEWTIQVQSSIKLDNHSEPEPDLCILNKSADALMGRIANAEDVYLVIEVADSTLQHDTTVKAPLYAKNDIPHYWVFNLKENSLLIYTDPQNGQYQQHEVIVASDQRKVEVLPDVLLPVSEYLSKL